MDKLLDLYPKKYRKQFKYGVPAIAILIGLISGIHSFISIAVIWAMGIAMIKTEVKKPSGLLLVFPFLCAISLFEVGWTGSLDLYVYTLLTIIGVAFVAYLMGGYIYVSEPIPGNGYSEIYRPILIGLVGAIIYYVIFFPAPLTALNILLISLVACVAVYRNSLYGTGDD